jgi:hypothetical protein
MAYLTEIECDEDLGRSKRSGGKNGECPICNVGKWNCKPSDGATEGALNCAVELGGKGIEINGYLCTKPLGSTGLSTWVPIEFSYSKNKSLQSQEQIQARLDRQAKAKAAKQAEAQRRLVAPAIVAGRDEAYRSLLGKAKLNPLQYANLFQRDFTDEVLDRLIADSSIIPVTQDLRVAGIANIWQYYPDGGSLLAARDEYGSITGAQFMPVTPGSAGKYIWNSSDEYPANLSDGTLPTVYIEGGNPDGYVCAAEGFLKTLLCSEKFDSSEVAYWISGGSCSQFPAIAKKVVQIGGANPVLLMGDAGSHSNPGVVRPYGEFAQVLQDAGREVFNFDYGQLTNKGKGDPDEQTLGLRLGQNAKPFEMDLGNLVAVVKGVMVAGEKATTLDDINKVRTLSSGLFGKKAEEPITISDRAVAGNIFAPSAHAAQSLINSLRGEKGLEQRKRLVLDGKLFNAESPTNQAFKDIKVRNDKVTNTISRVLNRKAKEKIRTIKADGRYLGQSKNLEEYTEKIKNGERVALCLSASMGTGKTSYVTMLADLQPCILAVVPTRQLGKSLAERIDAVIHNEAGANVIDRLVSCPASILEQGFLKGSRYLKETLIKTFTTLGGIVFFDEIQTIMESLLLSDDTNKYRKALIELITQLVAESHVIIVSDAGMSLAVMQWLLTVRPDMEFISSSAPAQARDLYKYNCSASVMARYAKALDDLKAGKIQKIAVFNDVANFGKNNDGLKVFYQMALDRGFSPSEIGMKTAETTITINGTNYNLDPNQLDGVKIFLGSPSVQAGVSIEEKYYFDLVFVLGLGTTGVDGLVQFTGRCRNYGELHTFVQKARATTAVTSEVAIAQWQTTYESFERIINEQAEQGIFNPNLSIAFGRILSQDSSPLEGELPINICARTMREDLQISNENLSIEFYGELAEAGNYTICDVEPVPKSELDELKAECKAIADKIKLGEAEETVAADPITQEEYDLINQGGHNTRAKIMAFQKFLLESLTNGAVKIENVDEWLEIKKLGKSKATINLIRFLYETHEQRVIRLGNEAAAIDYEKSFNTDNKKIRETIISDIAQGRYGEPIRALVAQSQIAPVSSKHPLFVALVNELRGDTPLRSLMGSIFKGSDKRQLTRLVVKLLKLLGFACNSKRTKSGYVYVWTVPAFTARVIEWRKDNPEFEHKNPNLQLPQIPS